MASIPDQLLSSDGPHPAWEVALLFPNQGDWSEDDYLALDTNQLVELSNGNLEVLPMPTLLHQLISRFLFEALRKFSLGCNSGMVVYAPLPIRIRSKTFREPDILFIRQENLEQGHGRYCNYADLVVEIVSPDREAHKRDYEAKRRDYAELGIPEYWIVDPQRDLITVLALGNDGYVVHGEFSRGDRATSLLLTEFSLDVAEVLDSGKNPS